MRAKEQQCIKWEDRITGITLFGIVKTVMEKSVVVIVNGLDDSTVVSHKRYKVIEEGEIDESAAEEFKRTRRAMGARKWL